MQLSVNYSPQAAELVRAGTITLDRWKCSDWPELIDGARATGLSLYLHFDLQAGSGNGHGVDLGHLATSRPGTDTPYVNLHIATRRADYPTIAVKSINRADVAYVLSRTIEDVGTVVHHVGAERVIVENLPYRGPEGARLRMGHDPTFIRRLCEEADCGLLLDIAHARTAAHHLGWDERTYLSALPVERLREVHVSGVDRDEHGRLREHMPLSEEDWTLLVWCAEQIREGRWARPWLMAFEYGGIGPLFSWRSEPSVFADQVPRLKTIQQKVLGVGKGGTRK
jgi:hypothetical protein